jgi:hypothetical protein
MRIATLMEYHVLESRKILRESCDGLTFEQQMIVEGIYNELMPLVEASLAPQQIQQLFGEIEKTATAGGDNRTGLGLGVDVAKEANNAINNLGKYLQNTTPVKMFDQKFEQLKGKVSQKFPKLAQQLTSMGDWAKENPGKTAAIIGVLTTLASLAGGPVGGAIAGQVLRGATELLKGEKLSTAVGKGVKTAVFGFLSGKAFEMLGKFAEGMRIKSLPFGPESAGFEEVSFGASKTLTAPGMEWTREIQGVDIIVDPEMASAVRSATNMLRMGGDAASEGFEQLDSISKIINSADYRQNIVDTLEVARQELIKNDSLAQFIRTAKEGLQAASQGAVAAAGVASDGKEKKESVYRQTRPLSEGQVYVLFNRVEQLDEGPADWMKKAGDYIGKKATNLTTKITADKLNSAWEKAGAPTDSAELAKFLAGQGISDQVIKQTFQSMKIDTSAAPVEDPKQAATLYSQVKTDIQGLDKKSQKQLMAYLQKQLGTA